MSRSRLLALCSLRPARLEATPAVSGSSGGSRGPGACQPAATTAATACSPALPAGGILSGGWRHIAGCWQQRASAAPARRAPACQAAPHDSSGRNWVQRPGSRTPAAGSGAASHWSFARSSADALQQRAAAPPRGIHASLKPVAAAKYGAPSTAAFGNPLLRPVPPAAQRSGWPQPQPQLQTQTQTQMQPLMPAQLQTQAQAPPQLQPQALPHPENVRWLSHAGTQAAPDSKQFGQQSLYDRKWRHAQAPSSGSAGKNRGRGGGKGGASGNWHIDSTSPSRAAQQVSAGAPLTPLPPLPPPPLANLPLGQQHGALAPRPQLPAPMYEIRRTQTKQEVVPTAEGPKIVEREIVLIERVYDAPPNGGGADGASEAPCDSGGGIETSAGTVFLGAAGGAAGGAVASSSVNGEAAAQAPLDAAAAAANSASSAASAPGAQRTLPPYSEALMYRQTYAQPPYGGFVAANAASGAAAGPPGVACYLPAPAGLPPLPQPFERPDEAAKRLISMFEASSGIFMRNSALERVQMEALALAASAPAPAAGCSSMDGDASPGQSVQSMDLEDQPREMFWVAVCQHVPGGEAALFRSDECALSDDIVSRVGVPLVPFLTVKDMTFHG